MKKYNEKLIEATNKVSEESLRKSKSIVKKLTHPSKKVSRIGFALGGRVGVGLILVGAAGLLLGRSAWAMGSIAAGTATIISHTVSLKRNKE
ncbi:hypothetical protein [Sporolactobacillus laevolacticus]|uniref:hypothetical protein n=1 Tax=Sporolactobacillus laevolacticus TaxID=33018 RepID=UPI0025B47790|nr:hypothetical protein [Sporolactobacillus laevolacticus]MDN3955900.1 hypothetical protein [Sporolactobacillus laevolacticus]